MVTQMPVIYIIGDSTVEDNKPPFRGWKRGLFQMNPVFPPAEPARPRGLELLLRRWPRDAFP